MSSSDRFGGGARGGGGGGGGGSRYDPYSRNGSRGGDDFDSFADRDPFAVAAARRRFAAAAARDPYLDPYAALDAYARLDPFSRDPYSALREAYGSSAYGAEEDPFARPPPEYYDRRSGGGGRE